MKISGIEKVSLVDFDGKVSTTLFCPSCNFACPFCHNGDLVNNALPTIPEEEILTYLTNRKKLLDAVVVSGGEPTLQKDLLDFLAKIKQIGYAVKLDTNGTNPDLLLQAIQKKLVDYVAMDVKNCLKDYPQTVGCKKIDTDKILQSTNILKQNQVDYEFRTTLVKQFHTFESISDMATLIDGAKKLFLQKFKPAETCLSKGLLPVEKADAQRFVNILAKHAQQVSLRGY